jgi:hypothetical protein
MLKHFGIDYSMTCPAITMHVGSPWDQRACSFFYATAKDKFHVKRKAPDGQWIIGRPIPEEWPSAMSRYDRISNWAMKVLQENLTEEDEFHITLEGYSMGSSRGRIFNIAENTGILKYKLFLNQIIPLEAAPTSVKKFALKGNAKKTEMYEQFEKETCISLKKLLDETLKAESPSGDIVDSYYICKYGFFDPDNLRKRPVES